MLKKYPDVKVIGHSQTFWCEISKIDSESDRNAYTKGKIIEGRLPELLRNFDNLYCDLSAGSGANAMMRDPEYAAKFCIEFCDRILYGCDITSADITYQYTFAKFLDRLVEDNRISENIYKKICTGIGKKLIIEDDFLEYLEVHKAQALKDREDYQTLNKKISELKYKYPNVRTFLEEKEPIDLRDDEQYAILNVLDYETELDVIELKESFKLGFKEALIY